MANQIVKLKKGSDYLYPYADFMGIDYDNVIATGTILRYATITLTQDCFVVNTSSNYSLKLNDSSNSYVMRIGPLTSILAKAGTIVGQYDIYDCPYKLFGIKR